VPHISSEPHRASPGIKALEEVNIIDDTGQLLQLDVRNYIKFLGQGKF
jgi:hypothetical protein